MSNPGTTYTCATTGRVDGRPRWETVHPTQTLPTPSFGTLGPGRRKVVPWGTSGRVLGVGTGEFEQSPKTAPSTESQTPDP